MNVYFKQYKKDPNSYLTTFFKMFHVCFGFDFGFFKYKTTKIRIASKVLCFLQSLLISLSCVWSYYSETFYNRLYFIWFNSLFSQYVVYVLIFIFKRSDVTFYQLNYDMQVVDLKLRAYKARKCVEKRFILMISLTYTYRIMIYVEYNTFFGSFVKPVWVSVVYFLVILACDTVLMINGYIYYAFYYRLRIFTTNLETSDNQVLLSYQSLYKSIVNIVEKYKSAYDFVVQT